MARPKMVTRLIEATEATAKVVIKSKGEFDTQTITVSGKYELTDKALEKAVKKAIENNDTMFVSIVSISDASAMYGMLESDFITSAHKLDPSTRKILEAEEATSEPETTTDTEQEATTEEPKTKRTTTRKGAK